MVSPDVLGASSGAGLGAALGLFFSLGYNGVTINAFLFGLCAVGIVCLVSSRVKYNPVLGLVLSGMMVSSLASAAVSFFKTGGGSDQYPSCHYLLAYGKPGIYPAEGRYVCCTMDPDGDPSDLSSPVADQCFKLGEDEAKSMGINAGKLRFIIVVSATLITSAAVSVSGHIGWVGLVIPHFARMLVGSDYRRLLPASLLMGGSFLLIVDNFARLLATSEIPIGILTAFVGAPFFLYLILREGNRL